MHVNKHKERLKTCSSDSIPWFDWGISIHYLIEITSSTSEQNAMQSWPSPIVYFPLLTPSCASSTSCKATNNESVSQAQQILKFNEYTYFEYYNMLITIVQISTEYKQSFRGLIQSGDAKICFLPNNPKLQQINRRK